MLKSLLLIAGSVAVLATYPIWKNSITAETQWSFAAVLAGAAVMYGYDVIIGKLDDLHRRMDGVERRLPPERYP